MILKAYRCTACHLTATISGGADMTLEFKSQTFACLGIPNPDKTRGPDGCGVIDDQMTELTERDELTGEEAVQTFPPPQCEDCPFPATPWNDGDPCPQCGGKGTFTRDPAGIGRETMVD